MHEDVDRRPGHRPPTAMQARAPVAQISQVLRPVLGPLPHRPLRAQQSRDAIRWIRLCPPAPPCRHRTIETQPSAAADSASDKPSSPCLSATQLSPICCVRASNVRGMCCCNGARSVIRKIRINIKGLVHNLRAAKHQPPCPAGLAQSISHPGNRVPVASPETS